ncbi:excinuclease ABC subunit UvrA [Candidatus Enterovibrio escicola]|uniref:UvrABC system protein A n=1 Tax=Candidatus Enterovibrio escicola TaxID=1927127 RepID=A0A2A5T6T4_9GAMM|nr:excinuclease ABC subunit UvrA [Candidatus Enterovibrio escacola]PCS23871.1 Excinuclease ABC subunit A [Candidatus Enterovibrio escacola]
MDTIDVRGARTHNLKNINLTIPRDKLIVITGLSGSGKSSLAFDTLYAEGQRRYVESLSTYARQFLSLMEKPNVDHIDGLSPAISIEQKSTSHNPRSTVGTITEVYDYLRLLYARVGDPRCPIHNVTLEAQTVSQMVDKVMELEEGTQLILLAPIVKERKGEHLQTLKNLVAHGFIRARINGKVYDLSTPPTLALHNKHTIEVVVDRFKVRDDLLQRLADSFETALELTGGTAVIGLMEGEGEDMVFSANFACSHCGYSMQELEPRMFSFNNPAGACPTCEGLGVQQYFDQKRVIQNAAISLAGGAVRGWDRRNIYYSQMLRSLAEHYTFDIETPWGNLPVTIQDIVLNGSGSTDITFKYVNDRGDITIRKHPFEGVLNNLNRRYHDTKSMAVREDLRKYVSTRTCTCCRGSRLREEVRHVFVGETNLPTICEMSIHQALNFIANLSLLGQRAQIANKILKEIHDRLDFLVNVGLTYLNLSRSADTLSGGEAQRIRLASQIGAGLMGVMYVLDEPSIGLHQRDNARLLSTLIHLRDLGNTVMVVEHDEEAIRTADHIIDIGPGAGVHGGYVVAEGSYEDIISNEASLTGQYLSGKKKIMLPKQRVPYDPDRVVKLWGANGNNLNNVNLTIPIGLFTCVTGVSGSGKSTLINNTFYRIAHQNLNGTNTAEPAPYQAVEGIDHFDKVINIDQSPIGRTPRSNPATYTGIFTPIRELFASTQESRSRGYKVGRFSFNVKGGRCEACKGDGVIKIEMHFLPDIYVPCETCKGKRFNRETLEVIYKGQTIDQVLEMTVEDAHKYFHAIPSIFSKLQTLMDVGLSYIRLGQAATTLSGGEAQRVKLARELSKRDTGSTLYILDEPTTGLHFHDIQQLLTVLHRLRDHGNTIVVIEHNLDVIKTADWILDLGPEGGSGGGRIIAEGTPENIVKVKGSHTARFLKPLLKKKAS